MGKYYPSGISPSYPTVQQQQRITGTAASLTMVFGSTPQQGELILIFATVPQVRTFGTPSGFRRLMYQTTTSLSAIMFWKIAGASESNSYTVTISSSNYFELYGQRISNVLQGNPILAYSQNVNASAAGLSIVLASTSIKAYANSLCVGFACTVSFKTSPTFSNSFGNLFPTGATNCPGRIARRTISSLLNPVNSTYTYSGSGRSLSILVIIMPNTNTQEGREKGSIQGSTFQRIGNVYAIRKRAAILQKQTTAQINARANFGHVQSQWHELSGSEKNTFSTFSPDFPLIDSFGNPYTLNPVSLYGRCNVPFKETFFPAVPAASAPVVYPDFSMITSTLFTGSQNLQISASGYFVPSDFSLRIEITTPQASVREESSFDFKLLALMPAGTDMSAQNFYAQYQEIAGTIPISASLIYQIRLSLISTINGISSPSITKAGASSVS